MVRKQAHAKKLTVAQSDKDFELLGRDLLPKHGVNNFTIKHLPAVKGYRSHVKSIPGSQSKFCKTIKYLQLFKTRSQRRVNRWSDRASSIRYYLEESLLHLRWCGRERKVENWDSVWTWKMISMARSRMGTTQYQTWRRSSTIYIGPHNLAKMASQKPTINLNVTNRQKM